MTRAPGKAGIGEAGRDGRAKGISMDDIIGLEWLLERPSRVDGGERMRLLTLPRDAG
jgi:hypothetical protein